MSDNKIIGLSNSITNDTDVVNKKYLDDEIKNISSHTITPSHTPHNVFK